MTRHKSNDKFLLTKTGYSIHYDDDSRFDSLMKASRIHGINVVLNKLHFLKNQHTSTKIKKKYASDINKLHNNYPYEIEGGQSDTDDQTTDQEISYVEYDKPVYRENDTDNSQTIWDEQDMPIIFEKHTVNDNEYKFYTMQENHTHTILNFESNDGRYTLDAVIDMLSDHMGQTIALDVNDKLQAYCQYYILSDTSIKINKFCANKGYGRTLYIFIEKYLMYNNYETIIMTLDIHSPNFVRLLNLFYDMGFNALKKTENSITVQKHI